MGSFRASSTAVSTTASSANKIVIPSATQVGDFILLSYVGSQTQPDSTTLKQGDGTTTYAGWNVLTQATGGTCYATWWWKIAASGDAGATVTITAAANAKTSMTIMVRSGLDQTSPVVTFATRADTTTELTHPEPTYTFPTSFTGDLIRCFASKDTSSAVSTTWTPPGGATLRAAVNCGGTSGVVSCQASNAEATSYTAGNWTEDQNSSNSITMVLTVKDAPAPPPPPSTGIRGAMTGGNDGSTATATSITLTLPAGCVAGDAAAIVTTSNVASASASPPAGWHVETPNGNIYENNNKSYVFTKVLTSADITAGTVAITWSALGKVVATGIVLYGLDAIDPFGDPVYTVAKTASITAPTATTINDNAPVIQFTSTRAATGGASVATYPSGWTKQAKSATNFATTVSNMSCSVATLNAPGPKGSYGGESISFTGPVNSTDSSEEVYTIPCQISAPAITTKNLYKNIGGVLTPVTLAQRQGSTIVLL